MSVSTSPWFASPSKSSSKKDEDGFVAEDGEVDAADGESKPRKRKKAVSGPAGDKPKKGKKKGGGQKGGSAEGDAADGDAELPEPKVEDEDDEEAPTRRPSKKRKAFVGGALSGQCLQPTDCFCFSSGRRRSSATRM